MPTQAPPLCLLTQEALYRGAGGEIGLQASIRLLANASFFSASRGDHFVIVRHLTGVPPVAGVRTGLPNYL